MKYTNTTEFILLFLLICTLTYLLILRHVPRSIIVMGKPGDLRPISLRFNHACDFLEGCSVPNFTVSVHVKPDAYTFDVFLIAIEDYVALYLDKINEKPLLRLYDFRNASFDEINLNNVLDIKFIKQRNTLTAYTRNGKVWSVDASTAHSMLLQGSIPDRVKFVYKFTK